MEENFPAVVRSFGASDVGFARIPDAPCNLPFAVSIVIRLSDAIIDEIETEPTYTYFNHYRSVNYLIDQILLRTGIWLQERGGRFITIAASQSRPDSSFEGRYSHKKAACLAGLGKIGRNNLFLHAKWGARVRLGTLFTDWTGCADFCTSNSEIETDCSRDTGLPLLQSGKRSNYVYPHCIDCNRCVDACPAHAFDMPAAAENTNPSDSGEPVRLVYFNPERCSFWMKKHYQHIGRGAVCGICMRVCPAYR